FAYILLYRVFWDNSAPQYKKGHFIQIRDHPFLHPAYYHLIVPIVVPASPMNVHSPTLGIGFLYGTHQDLFTKDKFIGPKMGLMIVLIKIQQGLYHRGTLLGVFVEHSIQIW